MNWQNVSKVGMPKKNGQFNFRYKNNEVTIERNFDGWFIFGKRKEMPTHWCEITPSCCQCGEVDGVDYCMKDGCVPF